MIRVCGIANGMTNGITEVIPDGMQRTKDI